MVNLRRVVLIEGFRGSMAMSAASVLFAVVGLTPSFSWVPEVPLLVAGVLLPTAILGVTGFRAGARTRNVLAGALAAAIAGALGGFVGGVSYVVFGKPALNIAVGLLAGAVVGGAIGAAGALVSRRTATSGAAPRRSS